MKSAQGACGALGEDTEEAAQAGLTGNGFDADPALLLWPNQPWPEPLLVYGVAGKQYTLESTADLGNSRSWARVTTFELTNSWRYLTLPSTAEAHTFFRIR